MHKTVLSSPPQISIEPLLRSLESTRKSGGLWLRY